jgi:hypothetical protein
VSSRSRIAVFAHDHRLRTQLYEHSRLKEGRDRKANVDDEDTDAESEGCSQQSPGNIDENFEKYFADF